MKNTKFYRRLRRARDVVTAFFRIQYQNLLLFRLNFYGKNRIRVNNESRKIVYVGHSYHQKTKSTGFVIDYLRQNFDVTIVWDDSWKGEQQPDLSFIDKNYLAVVFFQSIPSVARLEALDNPNIILIPMFDGVVHDFFLWHKYRKYKFLNFSSELHKRMLSWGLPSLYVQYFPEPQPFQPGNLSRVFFWQRTSRISISLIERLLGDHKFQIHLHHALDPGYDFMPPTPKQEEKFNITYSTWFPSREDLWQVLSACGVYIAPRELEGIGMSFLEAMAYGKAVLAPNCPTMNEYIKHNSTGFLYSLEHPEVCDFSNISYVQKNTHSFMVNGHREWLSNRSKILNYLYLDRY